MTTEFDTPQRPEHTIPNPEAFGMKYIVGIQGEDVATYQTEAELKAAALDPEQGRVGFAPDGETGGKKPVFLAGEGILTANKQPVRIYVDELEQLGYILKPRQAETGAPSAESETVVDTQVARRHGRGFLDALKAGLRITRREEISGPDPDAVPRVGRITVINPDGGPQKVIDSLPYELSSSNRR